MKAHDELYADLSEGRERRARLSQAPRVIERAEHGLGMEMNQRYQSSAVYQADQDVAPSFSRDPLQYYHATTYPGARLPHTWLGSHVPSQYISTLDLAGKGRFLLLTALAAINGNQQRGWFPRS